MSGPTRQQAIYLGGVSGLRPRVPADATKLEERARRSMSRSAFAYIAAGAGTERTVRETREAFERWKILPRILRDVAERDTSVELFGQRFESPFLLAPVGVLEMVNRDADLAVASAGRREGVPMIFSNQASTPMESVARELGDSPHWFQLYWSTSNELVESLVSRAEACGCGAIVVTLDTMILGWRSRDLEIGYLPFLRGKGIAQYTSDSIFTRLLSEPPPPGTPERPNPRPTLRALKTLVDVGRAYPDRFLRGLLSGRARAAVERFTQIYSRPSLTWKDLPVLRERTKLPILLKGVAHPDDARHAVELRMDGLGGSDHG